MSYCRWSSDFFQCDVYVYEDVAGGWTTHVAGRRLKHAPPPELRAMPNRTWKDHLSVMQAEEAWRNSLPCDEIACITLRPDGTEAPGVYRMPKDSEYIDLATIGPEAGQSFSDPTPLACATRLRALKATGFNVPQYAIDALIAESVPVRSEA